jgi:hypothetical protein
LFWTGWASVFARAWDSYRLPHKTTRRFAICYSLIPLDTDEDHTAVADVFFWRYRSQDSKVRSAMA